MRFSFHKLALALLCSCLPLAAQAESQFSTGTASPLTPSARVDFQITIPKTLFLRVGTGASQSSNATINLIDFVVPAASVGDGTPIAATAASGDVGNGTVTARVRGNNGNITLTSSTDGAMLNGTGDSISYSQINTTATVLSSETALPAPSLMDGSTNSVTIPAVASVVNRDAHWTYSYLNTVVAAPGTYGGVNTNNGRVTYTASMP